MKFRFARTLSAIAVTAMATMIAPAAHADDNYPNRAITVIVPFPAGGSTDVVARLITSKVSALWNNLSIVVENKGGASGMIGTKAGATAKPDGYTLTLGNNQTHATNATLFAQPPVKLPDDFVPIAMLTRSKQTLVVPKNSPFKSLQDLIDAGKAEMLNYATSSVGSSSHLVSESLSRKYGMKTTSVPYRGAAPALIDTLGGHVDFMLATYGSASTYIDAGDLRPLVISGEERDPKLPDVPTFAELGLDSLSVDSWVAFFAPAGTPEPVLAKWSEALEIVMKDPEVTQQLKAAGFENWFKSADEMRTFYPTEIERWAALVNQVGVKL